MSLAKHQARAGETTELEELRVRSEVSGNLATLRAATSMNAEIMQLKGELGCVRKGALADLLVLDGDPLADINVLTRPQAHLERIIKGGITVYQRRLDDPRD